MPFLTAVAARLAAIVEGAYPVVPVSGRSVPAARHKPARLHGNLRNDQFPGAHFHRAYDLDVDTSGRVPGDPPNVRAGAQRKNLIFRVDIGCHISRDAPSIAAGAGGALYSPTVLAHSDHEDIEQALSFPEFWSGVSPAIVGIVPAGDVSNEVIVEQARIVVSRLYRVTLNYAPGTAWG